MYIKFDIEYEKKDESKIIGILYDVDIFEYVILEENKENIFQIYLKNDDLRVNKLKEVCKREEIKYRSLNISSENIYNQYKKYYKKIEICDDIIILPLWEEEDKEYKNKIVIRLDSGMGWGNGEHPTTNTCLKLIKKYLKENDNVIDIGTGTGILSILAKKIGANNVYCCDIDKESIDNATQNFYINNIDDINIYYGELNRKIEFDADIIFANIGAEVAVNSYEIIDLNINEKGILIISGISKYKKNIILQKFKEKKLIESIEIDGWITFVYKWA